MLKVAEVLDIGKSTIYRHLKDKKDDWGLNKYIEKEKFYKDVVEDGSDVIFVVDFDLNILYHNPSVQHTIGYNSLVGPELH